MKQPLQMEADPEAAPREQRTHREGTGGGRGEGVRHGRDHPGQAVFQGDVGGVRGEAVPSVRPEEQRRTLRLSATLPLHYTHATSTSLRSNSRVDTEPTPKGQTQATAN